MASFFSGIYSAWCKKLSPLLQPFARHFGRSQNCKMPRRMCHGVSRETSGRLLGQTGRFFFRAGGGRGEKKKQQEIHLLKRSWQSSLNFDMYVFSWRHLSYLLLKIFENHERIVSGMDWFWGPLWNQRHSLDSCLSCRIQFTEHTRDSLIMYDGNICFHDIPHSMAWCFSVHSFWPLTSITKYSHLWWTPTYK